MQMAVLQIGDQYHPRIHRGICTFLGGADGKKRLVLPVDEEYGRTTTTQHFNTVPQQRAPWIGGIERTEDS